MRAIFYGLKFGGNGIIIKNYFLAIIIQHTRSGQTNGDKIKDSRYFIWDVEIRINQQNNRGGNSHPKEHDSKLFQGRYH